MLRTRVFGALLVAVAATLGAPLGVSHAASAAATSLLGGHGQFEKPVLTTWATYPAKSTFDGWTVRNSQGTATDAVTLTRAFHGFKGPQGQFLVLTDVIHKPAHPSGSVCRNIATVSGHRYSVSFLATVGPVAGEHAVIQVHLGTRRAEVILPTAQSPAQWKRQPPAARPVVIAATAAQSQFCISSVSSYGTPNALPSVDAVTLTDVTP